VGGEHEEKLRALLLTESERQGRKQVQNVPVAGLPRRLWLFLLDKAGIDPATCLGDMNKKERNRLVDLLTNDRFTVDGRTTFKEEFVTAGGIPLDEVDPATMQSRKAPGLYFAGEVLDVDGITGGFNFQAAWTTGFVAGHLA
jgi:predicted Rossmann fold flavoprotein